MGQFRYFGTIQTGDVDGNGHDDVTARGPTGVARGSATGAAPAAGSAICPRATRRSQQRDARGNVNRLKHIRFRRYPVRSGLDVTLRGPRRVQPGAIATYVARVHNRRSRGRRLDSSLWDVTLRSGNRARRIHELRRGRSRSFSIKHRAPRTAGKRFCVSIAAVGPGLRPAADRACARTQGDRAPARAG